MRESWLIEGLLLFAAFHYCRDAFEDGCLKLGEKYCSEYSSPGSFDFGIKTISCPSISGFSNSAAL
jgi:hypothetical protein